VTVVAKNCERADVFAKILYIMGKEQGWEFSLKNKIASLFLTYSGNIYLTPEIKKYIIR
jgi:thiamine biosynthesis lipoprotein ApbE